MWHIALNLADSKYLTFLHFWYSKWALPLTLRWKFLRQFLKFLCESTFSELWYRNLIYCRIWYLWYCKSSQEFALQVLHTVTCTYVSASVRASERACNFACMQECMCMCVRAVYVNFCVHAKKCMRGLAYIYECSRIYEKEQEYICARVQPWESAYARLCMHANVNVCTCAYMQVCVRASAHRWPCTCARVSMSANVYVRVRVHEYTWEFVRVLSVLRMRFYAYFHACLRVCSSYVNCNINVYLQDHALIIVKILLHLPEGIKINYRTLSADVWDGKDNIIESTDYRIQN